MTETISAKEYRQLSAQAKRFKPCSVEGCDGNAHWDCRGASGYCHKHYQRKKRNGSISGRIDNGEALKWLFANKDFQGDDCLTWPYATMPNGYGSIAKGSAVCGRTAHRNMCFIAHGSPPSSSHLAAHSCGNGDKGCVNPRHLSWKTASGNMADKLSHGTDNRGEKHVGSRLTKDDVLKIRDLKGKISEDKIAEVYNVSRGTVACIMQRRTWAWLQ